MNLNFNRLIVPMADYTPRPLVRKRHTLSRIIIQCFELDKMLIVLLLMALAYKLLFS